MKNSDMGTLKHLPILSDTLELVGYRNYIKLEIVECQISLSDSCVWYLNFPVPSMHFHEHLISSIFQCLLKSRSSRKKMWHAGNICNLLFHFMVYMTVIVLSLPRSIFLSEVPNSIPNLFKRVIFSLFFGICSCNCMQLFLTIILVSWTTFF